MLSGMTEMPLNPSATPDLSPRRNMLLGLRAKFGGGSTPGVPTAGIPQGVANPLQNAQFRTPNSAPDTLFNNPNPAPDAITATPGAGATTGTVA